MRAIFALIFGTGLLVSGCARPNLELPATDRTSGQLVSRDTTYTPYQTVEIQVYRIPVDGTLCSDRAGGNCRYWDGYKGEFDISFSRPASSLPQAEQIAWQAVQNHCARVPPPPVIYATKVTLSYVKLDHSCFLADRNGTTSAKRIKGKPDTAELP